MESHCLKRVCSSGRSLSECITDYNLPGSPELYEQHAREVAYNAPAHCADILSRVLADEKKGALILDVAAGPGQVGMELRRVGFERIHAHDGSHAMLDMCRRKNIYDYYICCMIDDQTRLPVVDGTYDAVTVSGAVLEHHLPPSSQNEFARVVRPGGYIVISYSSDILETSYGMSWQSMRNKLLEDGTWVLHGKLTIPEYYKGVEGMVDVFRKPKPCTFF